MGDGRRSRLSEQLDPVPERVCREEAADPRMAVVPLDLRAGPRESLRERVERRVAVHGESRVRLARGSESASTPMCSSCEPSANQTPPLARIGSGLGISGRPSSPP